VPKSGVDDTDRETGNSIICRCVSIDNMALRTSPISWLVRLHKKYGSSTKELVDDKDSRGQGFEDSSEMLK